MSRGALVAVAVVCAAGLASGFAARAVLFPAGKVALYPAFVQFNDGHIEGEPLEAHFELKNESNGLVTVTAVRPSCGCMAVTGKDGELRPPFTLERGATCPIALAIHTGGRVGPHAFRLALRAESSRGAPLETQADVAVNLQAALRAQPSTVIFRRVKPGAEVSAEVELADALPDPGVRIREVKVSNEKTMRVAVEPQDGPSAVFGKPQGRARARLNVSYTPDASEGRIQEMITVVPEDSRFPTLQIPLFCEIAEGPYRFSPPGLTIAGGNGAFQRTILFQSDDPSTTVSVVRAPDDIKIDVSEPKPTGRLITIHGDGTYAETTQREIVFAVNAEERSFPIRIIGSP